MSEAFEAWCKQNKIVKYLPYFNACWNASEKHTREVCARVAEQAGWDSLAEKAHGKYIAERIRDGDKGIGGANE